NPMGASRSRSARPESGQRTCGPSERYPREIRCFPSRFFGIRTAPVTAMLWSDTRFAFRQIRKSPGFALTVIATLALCIGVNTAVFSVLDAVLLRPVPYPAPDRLALLVTASRTRSDGDVK